MSKMRGALLGLAQALLIIVSLFVLLEGWQRDIHVPLGFSSDSLFYLMQSKGTIDNGWWWFNPMLGAPFGLNELAFPSNSNVDQAIVWLTSRFVTDAAASVNLVCFTESLLNMFPFSGGQHRTELAPGLRFPRP